MSEGQQNKAAATYSSPWPQVDIGNESNPSPNQENSESTTGNQLLNDRAEKYLREAANIEDVPDAQDQEEMDQAIDDE